MVPRQNAGFFLNTWILECRFSKILCITTPFNRFLLKTFNIVYKEANIIKKYFRRYCNAILCVMRPLGLR